MYKALLVALIGLFFSTSSLAAGYPVTMYGPAGFFKQFVVSAPDGVLICTFAGFPPSGSGLCAGGYTFSVGSWQSNLTPSDQCTVFPDTPACAVLCPDGSPAPSGDVLQCPAPVCPDGSPAPVGDIMLCPTEPPPQCGPDNNEPNCVITCPDGTIASSFPECPEQYNCPDGSPAPVNNPNLCPAATCSDGSPAPNNDPANCPINCDILTGGGGPECDIEEPPPCIGSACTEPPPIDPPPVDPPPVDPPPVDPPPVDPPPVDPPPVDPPPVDPPPVDPPPVDPPPVDPPPVVPPPPVDIPPPPVTQPPPIVINPPPIINNPPNPDKSDNLTIADLKSAQVGVESRLDGTNYELGQLRDMLNSRTHTANSYLGRLDSGIQNLNNKATYQNERLADISSALNDLKSGFEGERLTQGDFNVDDGITQALGISGNETVADLTNEPIVLEDYRNQFSSFLNEPQCPENIPVTFRLLGSQYSFDFYYKPVCDFMDIAGTILNWAVWLMVPFIVFGRRRAS